MSLDFVSESQTQDTSGGSAENDDLYPVDLGDRRARLLSRHRWRRGNSPINARGSCTSITSRNGNPALLPTPPRDNERRCSGSAVQYSVKIFPYGKYALNQP